MRKIGLFLIFFILCIYNVSFGYSLADMRFFAQQLSNNTSGFTTYQRNAINQFLNQYDKVTTALSGHNEFTSFICFNNGGSNNVQLYVFIDGVSFTANNQRLIWSNNNNSNSARVTGTNFYWGTAGSGYRNFNECFGLINGSFVYPDNPQYPVLFDNVYIKPFKFEPWYDLTTTQYYNVLTYVVKRSYSVNSWSLGVVEEYGNYDYYKFDLIDSAYDAESPLYSVTIDKNRNVINNNQLLFTGDSVYIPSRLMQFNYQYKLNIYLYTADAVVDTKTFYIRFIPVDSQITVNSGDSSGTVVSSSGDFTTQDSTNNIIDSITNSSEVDNIINEYLSGDIEDIASDFGYTSLDNPFTTFLFYILESTYDALTVREPVVLTASYNGMTFTLNSDDFTTPNSIIKTFIRALLIFIYIYGNYKYFHYLITLIETAKINKVVNEIGTDEFHDSNIM